MAGELEAGGVHVSLGDVYNTCSCWGAWRVPVTGDVTGCQRACLRACNSGLVPDSVQKRFKPSEYLCTILCV